MAEDVYTLGVWRPLPGREDEFVAAWRAVGAVFAALPEPPSGGGVLLRGVDDPRQFYSFGAWPSAGAVAAMRDHPEAAQAIARVAALCEVARPGMFTVAARA